MNINMIEQELWKDRNKEDKEGSNAFYTLIT